MATKTFIARQGLRDLHLVEVSHATGEMGRFYEGAVYSQTTDGQLKEIIRKANFFR